MKRAHRTVFLIVMAACASGLIPVAVAAQSALDEVEPTVLTFRPAGQPEPALKYRLLPDRLELAPGNAALFYHRANAQIIEIRYRRRLRQERVESSTDLEENFQDWLNGPLEAIPRDEAWERIAPYESVLREAALGARRRDCDWGLDDREEGYRLRLDEIQGMRSLARLVALRARLAVLDGQTDEAMHWIQTGYAMARHVSEGPSVIQWLVGVAISGLMAKPVEDLIQSPGAPSLYWAIAARPRPLFDLTRPMAGERAAVEQEAPMLRELDGEPWSPAQARVFADELLRLGELVASMLGLEAIDDTSSSEVTLQSFRSRLALAGIAAQVAPEARRSLLSQGVSPSRLDAMPTLQLVGLATYKRFQAIRDDSFKWLVLPYPQARTGLERANARFRNATLEVISENRLLGLFVETVPATQSIALAALRAERGLAALQCVEAIRLYADAHDGAFPPGLDAITEAPPPLDPATGEPFHYRVEGSTATLSAPLVPGAPRHPVYFIHYELKRPEPTSE